MSPINGEVHLVNVDKHVCLYVEEGRREGMGRGEMETVNICNSGGWAHNPGRSPATTKGQNPQEVTVTLGVWQPENSYRHKTTKVAHLK